MKVVHSVNQVITEPKRIPMHKDPVFLAKLRAEIIADHNAKIRSKKAEAVNSGQ